MSSMPARNTPKTSFCAVVNGASSATVPSFSRFALSASYVNDSFGFLRTFLA